MGGTRGSPGREEICEGLQTTSGKFRNQPAIIREKQLWKDRAGVSKNIVACGKKGEKYDLRTVEREMAPRVVTVSL